MRRNATRSNIVGAITTTLSILSGITLSSCATPENSPHGSESPLSPDNPSSSTVITPTTAIAGAGVLGNLRRPDESCAPTPIPLDADISDIPGTVTHAAGQSPIVPDPQHIVALAPTDLDALCALGLDTRIVGAALPDDSPGQLSYLGTVIHNLPTLGTASAPDIAAIAATAPDLIVGSYAVNADDFSILSALAPTVLTPVTNPTPPPGTTGDTPPPWHTTLSTLGAATGRAKATAQLLADFTDQAHRIGADADATHFQASVVQFTTTTMRIYGARNFAASVLSAAGADRPAQQRFTDKPYRDIGISDADLKNSADFSAADGDIVYLSFSSPQAKERAHTVLNSPAWRQLSAHRDNRVFIVNNEVWHTGQGLIAARGILEDLRWLNAPIN